jgi:hypothetical protein
VSACISNDLFEGHEASPACPSENSSIKMNSMEQSGNNDSRKSKYEEKNHSTTLSTTNLTRTDLESNSGLRGERPASNRPSHGRPLKTNVNPNDQDSVRTAQ